MQRVYLVLAIVGTVVPYVFFVDFLRAEGFDLVAFGAALFANGAVGGLSADLFISSFVFWVWMYARDDGPRPWLYIALNLVIGLSCALPAYLYALERRRANP